MTEKEESGLGSFTTERFSNYFLDLNAIPAEIKSAGVEQPVIMEPFERDIIQLFRMFFDHSKHAQQNCDDFLEEFELKRNSGEEKAVQSLLRQLKSTINRCDRVLSHQDRLDNVINLVNQTASKIKEVNESESIYASSHKEYLSKAEKKFEKDNVNFITEITKFRDEVDLQFVNRSKYLEKEYEITEEMKESIKKREEELKKVQNDIMLLEILSNELELEIEENNHINEGEIITETEATTDSNDKIIENSNEDNGSNQKNIGNNNDHNSKREIIFELFSNEIPLDNDDPLPQKEEIPLAIINSSNSLPNSNAKLNNQSNNITSQNKPRTSWADWLL